MVDEVVKILLEKEPSYSSLLGAFELLYSLLKIESVRQFVKKAKSAPRVDYNPLGENPLLSQEMISDQKGASYAQFLAKRLCEIYLFSETGFLPDSGNSRVSIKTQLFLIVSSLVTCDKNIIDIEIFDRPITSISEFSSHLDPGLKGAVASFVSKIIITAPPNVANYVKTLSALMTDQSHQAPMIKIRS